MSCLITDPTQTMAILQRKDSTYPVRRFRHALACFGGQMEPGEDPDRAIRREIAEEVVDLALRDAILVSIEPAGAIVTRYAHHVHCYLAVLPEFANHAARIAALPQPAICAEGLMQVHALDRLAGAEFAWDAGTIIRHCLGAAGSPT